MSLEQQSPPGQVSTPPLVDTLSSLVARRRARVALELPVRVIHVWRPDRWAVRTYRWRDGLPSVVVVVALLSIGVVLATGDSVILLVMSLPCVVAGMFWAAVVAICHWRSWLVRGVRFDLTEVSVRQSVGAENREVLLDWGERVEVVMTHEARDVGHVIVWRRGKIENGTAGVPLVLPSFAKRPARGYEQSEPPIVLWFVRHPRTVANWIERAVAGESLYATGAYR